MSISLSDDTNLSDLYTSWTEVPNRNFFGFWANSGCPKELLQKFVPQALEIKVVSIFLF